MGTVGTPSASFRPLPVLELGALANLADYGTTLPELLASSDVIDRIDVVGTHLVLTRARFDHERPFPPFGALHSHLDIYDRHTGVKLYEDIPLPAGSKVLGGGRFLYLLLNKDFPPWRIAKLRMGGGLIVSSAPLRSAPFAFCEFGKAPSASVCFRRRDLRRGLRHRVRHHPPAKTSQAAQNGMYFMYFGDASRSNGTISSVSNESLMTLDIHARLLSPTPNRLRRVVFVR